MFKKKGDILDLTLLQKRGILKNTEINKINEITDVLDLTKNPVQKNSDIMSNNQQSSQFPFNFLDNLTNTSSNSFSGDSFNITKAPNNNLDLQDFKVKIDDFEYKLNRFLERLEKIEEKINRL